MAFRGPGAHRVSMAFDVSPAYPIHSLSTTPSLMIAAITRLRLRSWRFLIPFIIHANRSQRQAATSAGCVRVITRKTRGLAFWTLSVWESEAQLRAYVGASPHRESIPKLALWCDEAVTTHWNVASRDLPTWEDATAELLRSGRMLRVKYPSQDHAAKRINVT